MIKSRLASFRFAFKGLADVYRSQPNMRIHLLAAAAVIALGLFFRISSVEWCILALTIGVVCVAELLNTALEYLTDLVSPDFHPLAGKAKDAAAAAVLVASIASVVVGCIIFIPQIVRLLK